MKIVYYSATGNTEKIANLIAKGIVDEGKSVELINVSDVKLDIFDSEEVIDLNKVTEASRIINKIMDTNNNLPEDIDELDIYSKEKGVDENE